MASKLFDEDSFLLSRTARLQALGEVTNGRRPTKMWALFPTLYKSRPRVYEQLKRAYHTLAAPHLTDVQFGFIEENFRMGTLSIECQWDDDFDSEIRPVLEKLGVKFPAKFRGMDCRKNPETRQGVQGYIYTNVPEIKEYLPAMKWEWDMGETTVRIASVRLAIILGSMGYPVTGPNATRPSRYHKKDFYKKPASLF